MPGCGSPLSRDVIFLERCKGLSALPSSSLGRRTVIDAATMQFPKAVMPHSDNDDTERRAERLEREAPDAIAEFRLQDTVGLLREARAIREAVQGEAHPDLIWTLPLWIEALGQKHRP